MYRLKQKELHIKCNQTFQSTFLHKRYMVLENANKKKQLYIYISAAQ